eukprot:TRINITY_DN389_c0_g1_i1.p1 TRINITY_DN389_c0_g1~~TRINITY_DN389_c0_g1_i1.p1  ORF type:complete len:380 (+),score=144.55 TRINITY_DN389_c0_g1_i1:85-1224(+)
MKLVQVAVALFGTAAATNIDASRLPAVPKVLNAGADGLPSLPDLAGLEGDFSTAAQGINSQVASLQQKMAKVNMAIKTRMAKQKAVFDDRLKKQEQKSQGIAKANAKIAKAIITLHKENAVLLERVKKEDKANKFRRNEIQAMQKQFDALKKYAQSALDKADDSSAPELEVLSEKPKEAKNNEDAAKESTDDSATSDSDVLSSDSVSADSTDDVSSDGLSFMQVEESLGLEAIAASVDDADTVSSDDTTSVDATDTKTDASADGMIGLLSTSIKKLRDQGKVSVEKLKVLFQNSFKQGVKRRAALIAQQKALKTNLKEMQTYHERLSKADKRLQMTRKILDSHIAHTGAFLGKLEKVADAPLQKVPDAFRALKAHKQDV